MSIHAHKVLRSLFRIPGQKRENIEWNEFAQVSVARLASPNSLLSVLTTLRRRWPILGSHTAPVANGPARAALSSRPQLWAAGLCEWKL